jgi:filamentous hemagglutinin family protein
VLQSTGMNPFDPKQFFDLSTYAHKALFLEEPCVWLVLKRINSYLASLQLGKIEGVIESGAILVNPEAISVGKGSVVESGAYIKGPCVIGENCEVRHGAYIRGNVVTGNKCVIGHATEVKNAIFLSDAHAGHFAYVGDSILGNGVNLGAGVKCSNLRFDQKEISFLFEAKRIESGLRKFGSVIGDETQIGCNAVTNPGTLLGKKCSVYPCLNISGFFPNNTCVKSYVTA